LNVVHEQSVALKLIGSSDLFVGLIASTVYSAELPLEGFHIPGENTDYLRSLTRNLNRKASSSIDMLLNST